MGHESLAIGPVMSPQTTEPMGTCLQSTRDQWEHEALPIGPVMPPQATEPMVIDTGSSYKKRTVGYLRQGSVAHKSFS